MRKKDAKSKAKRLPCRNPFAVEARKKKGGPMKDRRAERGGARNKSAELLKELEAEQKEKENPAP